MCQERYIGGEMANDKIIENIREKLEIYTRDDNYEELNNFEKERLFEIDYLLQTIDSLKSANLNEKTINEINSILDVITENNLIYTQFNNNIWISYDGTKEDTLIGKRQVFVVHRKID